MTQDHDILSLPSPHTVVRTNVSAQRIDFAAAQKRLEVFFFFLSGALFGVMGTIFPVGRRPSGELVSLFKNLHIEYSECVVVGNVDSTE